MKIPKIEVRLDKNYCLYDFMSRISFENWPFRIEKEKYGKSLRKVIKNFVNYYRKNKIYLKNPLNKRWIKFNSSIFEKLWSKHKDMLEKQKEQIKDVVSKEGQFYLKKVLDVMKAKSFPYNKTIACLVFPRLFKIKPEKYTSTGSPNCYGKTCVVSLCILPRRSKVIDSGKNLYVLWHELIHTLQLDFNEREIIHELVAELYEEVIIARPKKEQRERFVGLFKHYKMNRNKKIDKNKINKLVNICLSWNHKKHDIFELEAKLGRELKKR